MTKSVQFNVAVNNLEITAGWYQIQGIVKDYVGAAIYKSQFQGSSFSADLKVDESEYFAATVWIDSYTLQGQTYTPEKPICLLATLKLSETDQVMVCPESSIASIYAFARMTTVNSDGLVTMMGTMRNMKIAYGMKQNFYITEGAMSDAIKKSPNAFETNSLSMFNSLCNLMFNSIINTDFYDQFLSLAWSDSNGSNNTFLEAVRNILHDPFHNAQEIYDLVEPVDTTYTPGLSVMDVPSSDERAPKNWTLTFKSNTSGARNFIPSGTAFAVFDANDRVWVANNFRAGSGDSGTHCLVFNHDASPAPFSPVQGGGLLGVGFGAAIDPTKKIISFGNFGWGSEYNNPQEGSISRFDYEDGSPISPSKGYTEGLSRVQGMEYDAAGNLWMASVGCQDPFAPAPTGVYDFINEFSAVVVYLNGDPDQMVKCNTFPIKFKAEEDATNPVEKQSAYLKVFDVAPDNKGGAYVSCIGNYDENDADKCAFSAVYYVKMEGSELNVIHSWYSDFVHKNVETQKSEIGYESLRQVTIDGNGNVVVVGVTSSRATVLSPDLSQVVTYYDVNTNAPWGVKIDKKGSVFLANFGHDTGKLRDGDTLDLAAPFGVTLLRDTSDPSSAKLMTVPSGGDQVMLANGRGLYGSQEYPQMKDGKPTGNSVQMHSFSPIMRLTSTNIDGAGNLWCMNNWKPSVLVDILENPGGDGVVIYLGIAEPE